MSLLVSFITLFPLRPLSMAGKQNFSKPDTSLPSLIGLSLSHRKVHVVVTADKLHCLSHSGEFIYAGVTCTACSPKGLETTIFLVFWKITCGFLTLTHLLSMFLFLCKELIDWMPGNLSFLSLHLSSNIVLFVSTRFLGFSYPYCSHYLLMHT